MIDLRSDTVTKPPPAMRRAMAEAEVGDDVFGEDPTARRLEARVAEILGKEAAVFVPTGVMGNQLAIKVHTRPGDEVVVAERSHIFHYESGAPGLLSGVQLRPIEEPRGLLSGAAVAAVVRGRYDWEPRTRLVCLENTVNKAGGVVYPLDLLCEVAEAARAHHLALHLDGARLWNAAIASGHSEAEIAAPFDTVTVCLSKGLGAPVGSVLAGTEETIRLARRYRKLFGGGMRQIGILAAAGLYALDHHRTGLADDHARARRLATAMASLPAFTVDPATVETNIVIAETIPPAADVIAQLEARGVRLVAFGPHTVRATLHRDITDDDLNTAIARLHEVFEKL
jgi:threonine aldolase